MRNPMFAAALGVWLLSILLVCANAHAQELIWRDPAYWGLKKGAYIPGGEGCWGGNFKASRNRNKFDYEICASITYLQEDK